MLEITEIPVDGYEKVLRGINTETGLHAIISIHNTTLGPALGGCRLWSYGSENEALTDVLRLSRGMTYKASCAGIDLGGGKSVMIGDPSKKTTELFESMGEFVETFGGQYITAEDVNTSPADMEAVHRQTNHVTGLPKAEGSSGNPSPYTALGCFVGLKATLERAFGSADMSGLTIAIEGAGSVGTIFAKMVVDQGAKVVLADIKADRAKACADELGGTVVKPTEVFGVDCDVFAPSALGGSINDETLPQLKAKVIAGCANNQLLEERHGIALRERGIVYAPDYVINAGGLINVYNEVGREYDEPRAVAMIEKIYDHLKEIYSIADEEGICTSLAADRFAERRIEAAAGDQVQA